MDIETVEEIEAPELARDNRPTLRWLVGAPVGRAALALFIVALAGRGWVAWRGYFYWDDLIFAGRGTTYPLGSSDLLLYDHDGHFMPAAFLLAGVITRLAPLQWVGPVVSLVIMQGMASLAVLRLLRMLLRDRAALLVPFLVYLAAPLTLTSFAWWSAALNALPLQIGLAWICGDALMLQRTGRLRYAVSGLVVLVLTLAFFEKGVVLPVVAFALVVLVGHVDGGGTGVGGVIDVARRGRVLWLGSVVVLGAWLLIYTDTVGSRVKTPQDAAASAELVRTGVLEGLLPSLVGGPWSWARLDVSSPFAQPPTLLIVVAVAVAVVTVAVSLVTRRRVLLVWLAAAAYVLFDLALTILGRSGTLLTPELVLSLRYLADSSLVLVIALALVLRAPERAGAGAQHARPWPRVPAPAVVVACAALSASSVVSTVTFTRLWSIGPTQPYLTTARASLAAHRAFPLLDQPVPARVLWGLAYPNNLASRVLGPLPDRPPFAASTTKLQLIDDSGKVVAAHVAISRTSVPGPAAQCGYHLDPSAETAIPLDGPLIRWGWTVRLSYLGASNGTVTAWLGSGTPASGPVVRGPGELFLRLVGGGQELHLRTSAGVKSFCLGSAQVGLVQAGPAY